MQPMQLTELIDREVLQKIQDSFAAATRLHVLTRDAAGQTVTRHSHPTPLCDLIDRETLHDVFGDPINVEAARSWEPSPHRPIGIVKFVESIGFDKQCIGSIEMIALLGRGEPPLDSLGTLGQRLGMNAEELRRLMRESAAEGPEEVDSARSLLRSIAGVLSDLCRRAHEGRRQLRELSTLSEASALLTQTMDLQGRLDILTRIVTEALGVKGCLIRLLDEANGELYIKSVYNLSRRYLEKGPVNLSDSVVDQEAILGRVFYSPDVPSDRRMLYPDEAAEEGLRSMLCVALRSRGRVIGTIRVYTGQPQRFADSEVRLFQAIANQAAVAIENAALYEEALRAQALDQELAAAAQIQRHLIPSRDPVVPGFEIASRYIPVGTVGGDLFDFIPIEDQHLGIVIADVAGKGVPAAILMGATRAVLRGSIETVYAARDIIAKTNRLLCRDIGEEQFITLFYGALDTVSLRLTYCNAGHAPPILFRQGQHCELTEGGLVLGVDPEATYDEAQFTVHTGDVLLFYTDGLTDTMNPEHSTFGRSRLIESVRRHLGEPVGHILDRAWHAVRDFARGALPRDDFTIIVLKVL